MIDVVEDRVGSDRGRLTRLIGTERAQTLTLETLTRAGLREIGSAQDLLVFAQALESHGGAAQAVGRALHAQAVLRGAKE